LFKKEGGYSAQKGHRLTASQETGKGIGQKTVDLSEYFGLDPQIKLSTGDERQAAGKVLGGGVRSLLRANLQQKGAVRESFTRGKIHGASWD